jgi:hypothetical protein
MLPTAAAEFTRPPRLPLPIQGKVYTPGSPLISAADLTIPLGPLEAGFPALGSSYTLCHSPADEEDGGDDLGTVRQGVLPSVPTVIEWREPGNKVYVTGTFADWDRKYRLTKRYARAIPLILDRPQEPSLFLCTDGLAEHPR